MIRSQHVIAIYLCPIFLLLLTDHRSLKIGPPPSPGTHSDGKQGENVERQTSMACVKCIELETIFSYLVWSSSSPVATAILKRASHDDSGCPTNKNIGLLLERARRTKSNLLYV